MHLQRIQVPDFRVLKDVDITFEKEFVPSIFPLGSLNGGGKSTLLQLIFVLLHCSTDPNKIGFLKNMLYGFNISKNSNKKVLAILDIWDGVKTIKLEFFSCNDFYIKDLITQNGKEDKETYNDYLRFSISENIEAMKSIILPQEKEIHEIEGSLTRLNSIKGVKFSEEINLLLTEVVERFQSLGRDVDDLTISPIILEEAIDNYFIEGIQEGVKELQTILALTKKFVQFLKEEFYEKAEIAAQKVSQYLESEKIIYICNFLENESPEEVLLCQINNEDINQAEAELFLKELSQKVFLAAPATQVFLFLPKESIKSLFRDMRSYESNKSYYSELQVAKSKLPSFFAYDFLDVELLIKSFKLARDRDFIKAIETGEYGNHYKELLKELDLNISQ